MIRRYANLPCWRRRRWVEAGTARRRDGRGLCSSLGGKSNKALEPAPTAASSEEGGMTRAEAYRRIHDLDFMTAARILFTAPPEKKKFGLVHWHSRFVVFLNRLDFHLVQLFFACLPSLAVYLVAQYARYEIRRMEAEVELKKKAEEDEKAKQAEEEAKSKAKEMEIMGVEPDPELVKVKVRLEALEEAVKEIADETKKISHGNLMKGQKNEKKEPGPVAGRDSSSQDKSNAKELARSPAKEMGDGSSPAPHVSPENLKRPKG
ncbi:hypothetical protein Taro_035414 [Colocasia esculenta]|uniref:Uncharacterized protein n=1 Tax=Colocasia esculenta TaxID=4460 RepID=A0A843VUC4_COLES|nr:hypothetical protein [Colocasia esculenta]